MTPALLTIIVFLVVLIITWSFIRKNKRPQGFPPGPLSWPILGNLHQIGLEPSKGFETLGKKFGPIFSVDYGSFRSIVINDLHLLKECLNHPAFAGRPKFRMFLERIGPGFQYARGIICSERRHWAEQRRFVVRNLKDFGFGKSSMEGIIREEISVFIDRLRKRSGEPINTRGLFNAAVLNSLWRICTGSQIAQDDPELQRLLRGVTDSFSAATPITFFFPIVTKLFPKISGYDACLAGSGELCKFVTDQYNAHKATCIPGQPRDVMDVMVAEVEATSDAESSFYQKEGDASVVKSLEDLFLGGSDTTSTSLDWVFLCLTLYPDVQSRVSDEIQKVAGSSRMPELGDRPKMPYTECVLMEVLRFTSIFPLGMMHSTIEDVHFGGYFIPAETVFTPNLHAVHHNPEIWGDPECFRPERFFLPDGTANRSHEAFLAFSYGKRVCIGDKLAKDQLFLFVTSIIQQFRCSYNPALPKPSLKSRPTIVLSPNPYELIFHERA